MPLYDYDCQNCGPFSNNAPISLYQDPARCPDCGAASPRKVSRPFVANLALGLVRAHLRNEKSAEEPLVMNRRQFEKTGRRMHELQHSHPHKLAHADPEKAGRLEPGLHAHVAPERPWLVGH